MKRPIELLLSFILMTISVISPAQNKDSEGHVLVDLWKTYNKAVDADKPADEASVLETIKREAASRGLSWDWYDASEKYIQAKVSVNWKLRSKLNEDFDREVEAYPDPFVWFFHNSGQSTERLVEYIKTNRDKLSATKNSGFYSHGGRLGNGVYSELLPSIVGNDYEYALWYIFGRCSDMDETLKEYYSGKYPMDAFVEYGVILRGKDEDRDATLQKYADRWKGKAVALFARQDILYRRFSRLQDDSGSSSEQYRSLRADCTRFISDRRAFSGTEKTIAELCTDPDNLAETLDSKDIEVSAEKGVATVVLRNVASAQLKVSKDKKDFFTKTVEDKSGHYYVTDTVKVKLPGLDDGEYTITCKSGKIETDVEYEKHTLSLALKRDAAGYGVFVADYITGEPVKDCRIVLYSDDKAVSEPAVVDCSKGFVYLPETMVSKISARRFNGEVQASLDDSDGRHRLSEKLYVYRRDPSAVESNDPSVVSATVFLDRTAFNPEETVHFKTILYGGTYSYEVLSGKKLSATLYDPQNKEVASKELTTNEFGSAAGEFQIPRSERNGYYSIRIRYAGKQKASASLRVDDFVLPTFDLSWDRNERIYFPGETMVASGTIKSYSGHPLSSAKVKYRVTKSAEVLKEGELSLSSDGRFRIEFTASDDDWSTYRINVTVVDGTGESLEFNTSMNSRSSIYLTSRLENEATGTCSLSSGEGYRGNPQIVEGGTAKIRVSVQNGGKHPALRISYALKKGDKTIGTGLVASGDLLEIDLSGKPSGLYRFESKAVAVSEKGVSYEAESSIDLAKVSEDDSSLEFGASNFFRKLDGKDIAVQVGTTSGETWVVAELYGEGDVLLESGIVRLQGKKGQAGSLSVIRYPWKDSYGESVSMNLLFFHDGEQHNCRYTFGNDEMQRTLPLSFTRFEDRTLPSHDYEFTIKTDSEVELAASVFDVSTEKISGNSWRSIGTRRRSAPYIDYSCVCGSDGSHRLYLFGARPLMRTAKMATAANGIEMAEASVMTMSAMDSAEEAVEAAAPVEAEPGVSEEESAVAIRSDFQNTIVWEPALRSDSDGKVILPVRTSDKLSTYCVQLFAHDKKFANTVLRREMVVTVPVKVAVAEPQFLYVSDRYVAGATVSNSLDVPVSGTLRISFLNGGDYKTAAVIGVGEEKITLAAKESTTFSHEIVVPDVNTLGILVRFDADNSDYGSDAVFVSVPVYPAVQTITEAHSAIFRSGDDRDSLEAELRGMFVNASGADAELREISILDMIRDAVPEKSLPSSDNVLDQCESLWANYIIKSLGGSAATNEQMTSMIKKIVACRNSDGGYGWFAGMRSTPIITAVLLEWFARMGEDCPFALKEQTEAAVLYLDKTYFGSDDQPFWLGGISMEQYLHVRAMYPEVKFDASSFDSKTVKEFRKAAGEYLVPKKVRGLNARVFAKARRLQTLQYLSKSEDGRRLAKSWGIRLATGSRLQKSMEADVESLMQYAVSHKCGGCYYPDAVMPWRGLLEGELYAHTLICSLMTDFGQDDIAEGIRLWMMIQKETQKWGDDPAFLEAVRVVLDGKPETLATKVLALKATTTLPFSQIKESGNGFTVSRSYSVVRTVDGKTSTVALSDGDGLHLGDKVIARYSIWNEENRSFVRLSAPRPASLRPVQQLSGWYRGGYRNVLSDKTEYWFDSYPEENSEIEEEFLVSQDGVFQSPAVEIESLYAPHYRANGKGFKL